MGCLKANKPYTSHGRSFRKGGSSYRRIGKDRDRSRSAPSSTVTPPSKSGNGQATMTVTVPQELNKHQVQTHEGAPRSKRQRKSGKHKSNNQVQPCQFVEGWKHITNDPFVLSIVAKGYRLRFTSPPLLLQTPWEIRFSQGTQKIQGRREQISLMLQKNAISEISPDTPGFYSNIFLVCKASGGWCPVIDLKQLNHHIDAPHFCMHTISSVLSTVERGDYAFKIDQQDAHFHGTYSGSLLPSLRDIGNSISRRLVDTSPRRPSVTSPPVSVTKHTEYGRPQIK